MKKMSRSPPPTHAEPNNHFVQFRQAGQVENKRKEKKEGKKERTMTK